MQQIWDEQQPVSMREFPWLHLLVCVELIQRIEWLELDAGARVERLT